MDQRNDGYSVVRESPGNPDFTVRLLGYMDALLHLERINVEYKDTKLWIVLMHLHVLI